MKYTLILNLGNDAMRDQFDIAGALRKVADRMENRPMLETHHKFTIQDANGNAVGYWEVK